MKILSFLFTLALTVMLTGCGGGGDDSAAAPTGGTGGNGGTSGPTVNGTPNGKDFRAFPGAVDNLGIAISTYSTTLGHAVFGGQVAVQRVFANQANTVLPPNKLSVRLTNRATGISYGTMTATRSIYDASLRPAGTTSVQGGWTYTYYFAPGYAIASGTVIDAAIVDNGDSASASGDELTGFQFWIQTPYNDNALIPDSTPLSISPSPIPYQTLIVPSAG